LKGRVVLDKDAAADVLKAYTEHGIDLSIDYEHQTLNATTNGQKNPAAGWFRPEVRADGLWASDVRWTDSAAAMLRAREYRYFSPWVELDKKTRRPVRLLPMALTNWPATQALEPLVASADEHDKESFMDELLGALGLKDKAELLSAVTRLITFERDVLVLASAKTTAEAFGVLTALKTRAELADTVADELAQLKASMTASETKTLLDEAVKDGRVELARRGEFEQVQAKYGVDALKTTLSMLRKAPPEAREPKGDKGMSATTVSGFTAAQVALIKQIGADPLKVAQHKTQMLAARADIAADTEEG
jgi:phage I-like protein